MRIPQLSSRPTTRPLGLFFLAIATPCYGAVCGLILGLVAKVFYLIVVFPLVMGNVLGSMLGKLVRTHKVRRPRLMLILGATSGLVAALMTHYVGYIDFQGDMRDVIARSGASLDYAQAAQVIERVLVKQTGQSGFPGYLLLTAQEGISVGRQGFLDIKGPLVWAIWLGEAGILAFFAARGAAAETRRPFCATCGAWLAGGRHLGSVPARQRDEFVTLVRGGDYAAARALLRAETLPPGSLDVYLERCVNCEAANARLSANQGRVSGGRYAASEVWSHLLAPADARLIDPAAESFG